MEAAQGLDGLAHVPFAKWLECLHLGCPICLCHFESSYSPRSLGTLGLLH